jgi:hypothetical protein
MVGTSFFVSGVDVVGLLRRHAMDAYNVWWYPPLVLGTAAAVLSSAAGIATYLLLSLLALGPALQPLSAAAAAAAAGTVGAAAFVTMWFVVGV